jgi:hypothetical protein
MINGSGGMIQQHRRYNSFVLRIRWAQNNARADGPCHWQAWVQHVHSGETVYVQDMAGLLVFIERWAGSMEVDPPAARLK